jgi:hypothetical protein
MLSTEPAGQVLEARVELLELCLNVRCLFCVKNVLLVLPDLIRQRADRFFELMGSRETELGMRACWIALTSLLMG